VLSASALRAGKDLSSARKQKALKRLAKKRKKTRMNGYCVLSDFHDGTYECGYVSPWSISAHDVDTDVMVVGHDWSSEEWMKRPIDNESAQRGYSSKFRTNKNLFDLLDRHLNLKFDETYATNAFPFVKRGQSQGSIRSEDMTWAVQTFLLPQIEIIEPQLVICLGLAVYNALRRTCGHHTVATLTAAISEPFDYRCSKIVAVAHTGAFGPNNRGPEAG